MSLHREPPGSPFTLRIKSKVLAMTGDPWMASLSPSHGLSCPSRSFSDFHPGTIAPAVAAAGGGGFLVGTQLSSQIYIDF